MVTTKPRLSAAVLVLALLGAVVGAWSVMRPPGANAQQTTADAQSARPNIVFILTDDLSKNIVKHMSAVRALKRNGTSFARYFVTDSLCCPSRSTILTGRYPHNTHVRVNESKRPHGGFKAFRNHGNQQRTYAVRLDKKGYRTGYLGKYMNGYKIRKHRVPPGWDEWHVTGSYSEIGGHYAITRVTHKGAAKHIDTHKQYLNDLLGKRAKAFVNRAHRHNQAFFLQISSYAPHRRVDHNASEPIFPPAKRDRPHHQYTHGDCGKRPHGGCLALKVPRGTGFGEPAYKKLDRQFRNRVRMMQSLNDQIIALRKRLKHIGQLRNTYFVFSSDNGFHLGEHGLFRGKGSAYDHDTQVPLIVKGPGVPKGKVRHELTQTVDLYPTFQRMARLKPRPSNGRSLMKLLHGDGWPHARDGALVEHTKQLHGSNRRIDPDLDGDRGSAARAGFVPGFHTYDALRTRKWLYVEYKGGRHELYNLVRDPGQRDNVYADHRPKARKLSDWLHRYTSCGRDSVHCWRAGHHPA